jgi:hypothetical protein
VEKREKSRSNRGESTVNIIVSTAKSEVSVVLFATNPIVESADITTNLIVKYSEAGTMMHLVDGDMLWIVGVL